MNEKKARQIVRERSGGVCEVCASARATNWHHRQNRGRGKVGQWCPTNGLDLCGSGTTGCHGYITSHPTLSRDRGWAVPSWGDPATTPVLVAGLGLVLLDDAGAYLPLPTERTAS